VFHGFGWKGKQSAGEVVSTEDYVRYCRYLLARYGARPAIWLLGGDGHAKYQHIDAAGQMMESLDAYHQPTGIHYCPHGENNVWQDRDWLDFQWCQTGHNGEHLQQRVADMWRNTPAKAVMNGETTYENMGNIGKAAGWWQGHEAWCNLCSGGTMGVMYGAGSLWNWIRPGETDHPAWARAPGATWDEALEFEGANYIGKISEIVRGLPIEGMQPNWTWTYGRQALAVPGKLFVVYLPSGGYVRFLSEQIPRSYRVVDARTGVVLMQGHGSMDKQELVAPEGVPCVVICSN
jgi:hypothetical protein